MPLEDTIRKADAEIAKGELWRAREIISSSLNNYGYSPELFRKYASVLLAMSDNLEAGKYLFLSEPNPNEKEKEAIDLFLARYARKGGSGLFSSFPGCARLPKLSDYPDHIQNKLRELGAPEKLKHPSSISDDSDTKWMVGCGAFGLFILITSAIGIYQLVRWIID